MTIIYEDKWGKVTKLENGTVSANWDIKCYSEDRDAFDEDFFNTERAYTLQFNGGGQGYEVWVFAD